MAASKPESGAASGPARNPAGDYRPQVVWHFTDGKPGHENQALGLLAALRERVPVDDYRIPAEGCRAGLMSCLSGRDAFGKELPDPDLILGAGHATHLPMLKVRRVRGGRVVVLMKPTLPLSWFDLCVIPAHDRPRRLDNVLVTRGVLSRVRRSEQGDEHAGLILVGGPSTHVSWSSAAVVAQIRELLSRPSAMHWTLTTSRRTPADFLALLDADPAVISVVPCEQTGPEWLPEMLGRAAQVWVTQDSVSMVYEALTSGAAVGLLAVPWRSARDRLGRGVEQLVQDGLVTPFTEWQQGRVLQPPAAPFDEAARCAEWICRQWLNAD